MVYVCGSPGFPDADYAQTPQGRDLAYKAYRDHLVQPRNPMMFRDANWSTRIRWDKFVVANEEEEAKNAEDTAAAELAEALVATAVADKERKEWLEAQDQQRGCCQKSSTRETRHAAAGAVLC